MSKITSGHGLLVLGLCIGFIVAEPVIVEFEINRLSNAPYQVQQMVYATCASLLLSAVYVARRVD